MTVRPSSDDLENEFMDIIDKGTMVHPSGVIDISLPSRFVRKCMREGFQQARVIYEVFGTFEPEKINCSPYTEILEKLERRVAEYLVGEYLFGKEVSADELECLVNTTPYPEQAKDIVQVVLGVKDEC